MSLLAGAWFLPATRGDWHLRERLALCVALAPFVVAAQATLLILLGVPVVPLSHALLLVNLFPAVFVLRELRAQRRTLGVPKDFPFKLLTAAIPLVWLIASWWLVQDLRAFGWHNLLHSDIVYQLAQRGLTPEEPELAGLPLAYSWFGHSYWLVTGILANRPPTSVFPLQNVALLGALLVLIYHAARRLGVSAAFAMLAAVLAVFANNLVREILAFGSISTDDLLTWAGEERLSSALVKYRALNLMPASFAVYAGLLFVWAARSEIALARFGLLHGGLLTASALVYPVGFPAALCLSGTTAATQLLWSAGEGRRAALHQAAVAALGAGVAGASLWLWATITQMGGSGGVATPHPAYEMSQRLVHLASAVGPFVLLALPGLWRAIRTRNAFVAALGLSAALMFAVYAVFEVRHVEYKYVLYARLGLGIPIAYGLAQLVSSRRIAATSVAPLAWLRAPWTLPCALLAIFAALSFPRITSDSLPASLVNAPPIDESSFQLRLAANSPHAGWTRAIRRDTPPDTIVIATELPFHAGSFTGRSLYYPCEALARVAAGYAISSRLNLVRMRGYDEALFAQRGLVVDAIYAKTSQIPHRPLLRELQKLARPIAILSTSEGSEFLLWCRRNGHGRLLFRDDTSSVWLLGGDGDAEP